MRSRKKIKAEPDPIIPFRYSARVTLHPGDLFRCSGGPYYITQTDKKIVMGKRGLFVFVNSANEGIMAKQYQPRKETPSGVVYIYMGETKVSDATGTYLCAHKIRKLRKKGKES
jgi:hypothetical protein